MPCRSDHDDMTASMWDRHINFSKGELKHLIEGQSDLRDPIAEWNGKALLTPAGALAAARNLPAFIAELPKAELHCHIEGTLTPRRAYLTAKTNYPVLESKMDPAGVAQRREEFTSLLPFLMEYNDSSAVLKTREDFRGLMLDYCPRLPGPAGRLSALIAFLRVFLCYENRFRMGFLYGRAGRFITALFGGFRPGQCAARPKTASRTARSSSTRRPALPSPASS